MRAPRVTKKDDAPEQVARAHGRDDVSGNEAEKDGHDLVHDVALCQILDLVLLVNGVNVLVNVWNEEGAREENSDARRHEGRCDVVAQCSNHEVPGALDLLDGHHGDGHVRCNQRQD